MDFSQALQALKRGQRVRRSGWNGRDAWLALILSKHVGHVQRPEEPPRAVLAEAWLPFIAMRPIGGGLVPWLASQTDLLAEDWETVP